MRDRAASYVCVGVWRENLEGHSFVDLFVDLFHCLAHISILSNLLD